MMFTHMHSIKRRGELLACAAVVLWLTGCASGPVPDATRPERLPAPVVRPSQDGPPDRPPADLTQVPDAVPKVEPILPKGPNKPYVVEGQAYEPLAADVPFKQRGVSSWYGAKFHGRRTASGEVYSMYGMTAAHRTLPIPSYARVRAVQSGKSVIVRINDRGPFHSSRVLDLSYTAAAKLDLLGKGTIEVEIERLTFDQIRSGRWQDNDTALAGAQSESATEPAAPSKTDAIYALASRLDEARPQAVSSRVEPVAKPLQAAGASTAAPASLVELAPSVPSSAVAPAPLKPALEVQGRAYTTVAKGFWVQLAAFSKKPGVDAFQQRVAHELEALAPLLAVFHEGALYRLQVGPYAKREEAQSAAQRIRDALQLVPMVVERR